MSCEDAAWMLVEWGFRLGAVIIWCAMWLGLATFILAVGGKLRWVR